MPRPRALAALLAVAALLLAGCSVPAKHQSSPTATSGSSAAPSDVPAALAPFYTQTIEWKKCDEGQCGTLRVPVDYDDPSGPSMQLAVARHQASGDRIGSLLVNPGGPGGSGVDFVPQLAGQVTPKLLKAYDIVGFDPRGVQRSTPAVKCVGDAALDKLYAFDPDTSTDAGLQQMIDMTADFSVQCLKNTGSGLGHVDTVAAAKDLDVLRAAVGDDELHYLGFSYGTKLGATYAALFPQRSARLVLDGALDPTLTSDEVDQGQAAGFEGALRAYVKDCQGGSKCPLTGSVDDGMQQVRALLDRARANPLPTSSDRRLTQSLAFSGIAVALYSKSFWPTLTVALRAAIVSGNGTVLLALSDVYYDRDQSGHYTTNAMEAFRAINCLDQRSSDDFATMRAEAKQVEAVAPTVGQFFSYGGTSCADWAVPEVGGLKDYSAQGAPPILVVGTTNDPATPYAWAQSLATTLSSGVLLTYQGEGHTAYRKDNTCIAKVVDAFLVDGTVPADGTRC
ncbi:alpha/beta hydrolase [Cellulomonas sp. HZM]|uniref:alpha/beta hydrolase n=1 Tax=Cellulomonas sp. HZM TaxID=1454010 RepID=UPI0005560AE9|nr:alpha/beta hydrolase [Cellulomonas sp. HZM]